MGFLKDLFSDKYYLYWVEITVIAAIVIFILYIAYALNLHRKE